MQVAAEVPETPKPRQFWRWVPLAVVAGGLAAAYASGLTDYLSKDHLKAYQAFLADFVAEKGWKAVVAYLIVYVVAVGLSIPGASLLTAAGEFMFGTILGTVLAASAATAGATIIFLVARTSVGEFLAERAGPRLQKLRLGFAEEAFNYLLVLRLAPIFPFWLVNIAAALFGMKVAPYVLATAIGILPGTLALAHVGRNLDRFLHGHKPTGVIVALALLALMALIPLVIRRRRRSASTARDA